MTSIGGGHGGHHGSTSASPLFPSFNGELSTLAEPSQVPKCGLTSLLPRPLCKRPVRLAERAALALLSAGSCRYVPRGQWSRSIATAISIHASMPEGCSRIRRFRGPTALPGWLASIMSIRSIPTLSHIASFGGENLGKGSFAFFFLFFFFCRKSNQPR